MDDLHQGHRQRLRDRFQRTHLQGYAPHETLELLLTFAIPRKDTNPLAHALMDRFGSFSKVLEASYDDLIQVDGMGNHAAVLLNMVLPMMRQYLAAKSGEKALLQSANACKAYARSLLLGETCEHVDIIALDAQHRVITHERAASGDEGEAAVSVRKVIAMLLRSGAAQAVMAHNHPDGSLSPSLEDRELTHQMQQVMASVGIRLHDHIIIAGTEAYSFRENGLIK